jgi:ubiquinone/menaquinone biosynthesis C-methylase UbiE
VSLAPTNDFSRVAPWYDATRNLPEPMLERCYDRLLPLAQLRPPAAILDAGCGTGQLSRPLARRGYKVTGIDVSAAMLDIARVRSPDTIVVSGDVRNLGFSSRSFDAVVASKLFQHVGDWTRAVDEILRVIRPGGMFAYINERGAFKNAVRTRFAALCDQRGHVDRYVGLRDRAELSPYLVGKGARRLDVTLDDLSWEQNVTYGAALDGLRQRLYAEFWGLDDANYDSLLTEVSAWIGEQPAGLNTIEAMRPHLTAEVFVV